MTPTQSLIVQGVCGDFVEYKHNFLYVEGLISYGSNEGYFNESNLPELTFEEFKTKYQRKKK